METPHKPHAPIDSPNSRDAVTIVKAGVNANNGATRDRADRRIDDRNK